jgi:predicted ATPase
LSRPGRLLYIRGLRGENELRLNNVIGSTGGRLPAQVTRLVGRETEVGELSALLDAERLVTLTGPGGAGKSRLAIAVAEACADRYPGGVVWVPLATLTDPARVPDAVAEAVGVGDEAGVPPFDAVHAALCDGPALLLCDNCEHVVDEVADFLERLLSVCPLLTVLATSQQRLAIQGEVSWAIPPLAVPPEEPGDDVDVEQFESVRLFVERARGVQAGFELTESNTAAVARICRRLDGIPLAIELAACRVNVLAVEQIDTRLESGLQVLVGGSRTALPRHRAIQATMDWSYRLLDESERRLFARLSVLSGTFSLDVVEALAGDYIDQPLDVLAALVAKSLVVAREHPLGMRYKLLRVVHEYARTKLVERGESLATQAVHARYYVALAERAEAAPPGHSQREWLDLLDAERENLRVAHAWCVQGGWSEGALRLAGAVWQFCVVRGHYRDGREWLESALRSSAGVDGGLRAKALVAAGRMAHLECDYDIAVQRLTEGLRIYTELDDDAGMAAALEVLGSVARERGDYPHARRQHQRSLELATARADNHGIARALNYLAFVAWLDGDFAAASKHSTRSQEMFAAEGDPEGSGWALLNLGSAALYADDLERADELLTEALAVCREARYREGIAWSLNQLGTLAVRRGDPRRGEYVLRESLRIHYSLGDRWRMTSVLDALAATALARGATRQVVRLLSTATKLREDIGTPVPAVEQQDRDRTLAWARSSLGSRRFDKVWTAGAEEPPREVIRDVLTDPSPGDPGPDDGEEPVLRLVTG